jgi:hypothetical protein
MPDLDSGDFIASAPVTQCHRQDSDPRHALPATCTGGHGVDPNEQNTQQSPDFGRSNAPHPTQS